MTPQQKATFEKVEADQVAFPPLFEMKGGKIAGVFVSSFAGPRKHGEFPRDFWMRLVVVDTDGSILKDEDMTYVPRSDP